MKKLDISKYKGFLFDLDGTLFDTIGIWNSADEILIRRLGGIPHDCIMSEREDFLRKNFSIDTYLGWAQYTIDLYGLKNVTAMLAKEMRLEICAELLRELNYKEHAANLLLMLKKQGYSLALVTATNNDALEIYKNENLNVRNAADFKVIFGDNIVTNNMVEKKKPEPESYIKAMELLGLKADECLVFEDSYTGALAATRAGIDICVVYDKHSDNDRKKLLELTPFHIHSFSEILKDLDKFKNEKLR